MASFVPNYQKKIRILAEREAKLRKLLAQGATEAKLLELAAAVRDARIRAERAKRESLSPEDTPELRKRIARFDAKITAMRAIKPADVLAEFRSPA